jgi:hypothetical protein
MKTFTGTIDGKHIAWHELTEFRIQVGKGKSAYKTKYSFTGNLGQAVLYYGAINIGNGYKKRLYMVGANKPIIARVISR